ncbi:hypothetical protein DAI22_01g126550 [Oryza sativa Japonica Group]|nr:hypothetical protein DAI22_01g126550 [Oryza sativa Japonica Group]
MISSDSQSIDKNFVWLKQISNHLEIFRSLTKKQCNCRTPNADC